MKIKLVFCALLSLLLSGCEEYRMHKTPSKKYGLSRLNQYPQKTPKKMPKKETQPAIIENNRQPTSIREKYQLPNPNEVHHYDLLELIEHYKKDLDIMKSRVKSSL